MTSRKKTCASINGPEGSTGFRYEPSISRVEAIIQTFPHEVNQGSNQTTRIVNVINSKVMRTN